MIVRLRRALVAAALSAGLTCTGLTSTASATPTGSPSPEAAVDCYRYAWDPSQFTEWGVLHHVAGTVFHYGPYGECPISATKANSGTVRGYCLLYNDPYGNEWYFTNYGWVYADKYVTSGEPPWAC